jgi:hypothetical protein
MVAEGGGKDKLLMGVAGRSSAVEIVRPSG